MRDTESGLDYFNARYYSPEQGRFVSVDPANAGSDPSDPQTWNGYAYVGGNPMTYTDPSGRFLSVVGIGGGAGTDILGAALPIVNAAIVGIDFLRFVFGSVSNGDSGARRTGFRGEREQDSVVKTNTIPG
jgi:RHS repeat-associated protein